MLSISAGLRKSMPPVGMPSTTHRGSALLSEPVPGSGSTGSTRAVQVLGHLDASRPALQGLLGPEHRNRSGVLDVDGAHRTGDHSSAGCHSQ